LLAGGLGLWSSGPWDVVGAPEAVGRMVRGRPAAVNSEGLNG
jgi:hypothetical protein